KVRCGVHVSVDGQSTHVLILSELLDCSAVPVAELTEIVKVGRRLAGDASVIHVESPQPNIRSELASVIRNPLPVVFVGVHSRTHSTGLKAVESAVDKVEIVGCVLVPDVGRNDL
ncbi:hypothetical protein PFISCL1PPCAC_11717, partial [Pristionchus fissidentatus]